MCIIRSLGHRAPAVSLMLACALDAPVSAQPITLFKIEDPLFYVQGGVIVNAVPGPHPLVLPPPGVSVFWDAPGTVFLAQEVNWVTKEGECTHLVAPHSGEEAPGPTWSYGIGCEVPQPWGAREARVRWSLIHPGGTDADAYMVVVGALSGTTPGPLLGRRVAILAGSIGRHIPLPVPGHRPIYGGATLVVPSGLPSPVDQDFPGGQLLALADPVEQRLSALILIDGVQGADIACVEVRDGHNGPVLIDLRPMMQLHELDTHASALVLQDGVVPPNVMDAIAAGHAQVSVKFPPTVHPDSEIAGMIVEVPEASE